VLVGLEHHHDPQCKSELLQQFVQANEQLPTCVLSNAQLKDIVNAALNKVDRIGTDLPQTLARSKKALIFNNEWQILDYSHDGANDKDKILLESTTSSITTAAGVIDISDDEFTKDVKPLNETCKCLACQRHHRSYIHHLVKCDELLGYILLFVHNLHQLLEILDDIRSIGTKVVKSRDDSDVLKRFSNEDFFRCYIETCFPE